MVPSNRDLNLQYYEPHFTINVDVSLKVTVVKLTALNMKEPYGAGIAYGCLSTRHLLSSFTVFNDCGPGTGQNSNRHTNYIKS
jgi:hypothetical protein